MEAKSVTKRGNSIFTEASSGALVIAMTRNVSTFLSVKESLNLLTSIFSITAEIFPNSVGHTIRGGEFIVTEGSRGFTNARDCVIEDGTFIASSNTYQVPTHYQTPVSYRTAQGNAPPRSDHGQQGKSEWFCSNSCQAHVVVFRV